MKINSISFINFTGATVNINALSDTHGQIDKADRAYQAMMKKDAFIKEGRGKANFLIIGGDWFISGGKKGYKTNPNKTLMEFQKEMYNKFVEKIKEKFPKLHSYFVPGNHDLDGGVKNFHDGIRGLNADIIMSNLDFENSGALSDCIEEGKIVSSKTDFITDDKDKNKMHPILNLGVCPVNMSYYQPNTKGMTLFDNINASQKTIKPEQYEKTMEKIRGEIESFKKKYPKGLVILTNHTGVGFADECAKRGNVDLIFDGHEHKDDTRFVNGTPIVALSQNFKKIVNAKIEIGDFGDIEEISLRDIRPDMMDLEEGELAEFNRTLFNKDYKKVYTINSDDKNITKLDVKNVRGESTPLANLVLDVLIKSAQQIDSSIQIFALNASAIRNGFELTGAPNVSSFEVGNVLNGITPEQGQIYTTEVSGEELSYIVMDNFLFNSIDSEKNPIIHYSGITVDKNGLMNANISRCNNKELCKYITFEETGEKIDPKKTYKIANPEKYFIKSNNEKIRKLKNRSCPLNVEIHDLFENYFENIQNISFVPKKRF